MARNRSADVEEVQTVDDEVETVAEGDEVTPESSEEGKTPKAKAEPKRGELPEGYVTPIGLAKVLTERGLHTNREGVQVEVRPQMVYSYKKNAPKDDPFPIETITDSIGASREALKLDEGVAWWERKNARVATRKQNAADKATKAAERKAAKEREAAEAPAAEAESESAEAIAEAE